MPSKSIAANQPEASSLNIPPSTVCPEQWWRAAGYDPIAVTDAGQNTPKHTLFDHPVKMTGLKDDKSLSNAGDADDETSKDSETTGSTSTHQDGSSRLELQKSQYGESSMSNPDCFPQHPQVELVGHTIACAPTAYPDLCYGGMMSTYGHQLLVPQFYGMHQPSMPLPIEMAPEPVYVNAKQYHGILRRRQVRAKAELEKKLIKVRKPYLHESRHQHALRRARGSGGRFAKKGEVEATNHSSEDKNKLKDAGGSQSRNTHEGHTEVSSGLGDHRAGEGQSNQQWGSMSTDQVPRRALAI